VYQAQRVHCVGIGGTGISAIARVLLERGVEVTGSDLRLSPVARALADSGARVYAGHDAAHVGDVDALLVSSAIPEENPEIVAARERGIPVFKRAAFLGELMAGKIGVAVAGTHGKTTTTGMIAWILSQAGWDPTFIVGGVLEGLNTNAHAGQGAHFVIEADEYDHMFLGLRPTVAAITHLEHDHPDCFPTFAAMQGAFQQFTTLVPAEGLIVGCGDQPAVAELLSVPRQAAVRTCGLGPGHDVRALEVRPNAAGGHDFVVSSLGQRWGCVRLPVPGLHNVQNALVALAVADWLGVDVQAICDALATFPGVGRRFQVLGEVNGITVVDDYGHHPTEIRATLAAARARYGDRPLWAVFQPHTYSRIKVLWKEFVTSFRDADHVIVLDVYAAREKDPMGVSAAELAAQMNHPSAQYISGLDAAAEHILAHLESNAVVVTLSAGDGNQVGTRVLKRLRNGQVYA
jgi:UDP-N-acetylmuramate--alanine ligase